jgi:hypothetical protein
MTIPPCPSGLTSGGIVSFYRRNGIAFSSLTGRAGGLPNCLITADCTHNSNKSFWHDAISDKHFPGARIILDNFNLTEWLPFSPGRYYTPHAEYEREKAVRHISRNRNEYLPEGKVSMMRGGIGAVRLTEKIIGGNTIYFLGASSTGIAHQGIPVALPTEEYHKVMPLIKEHGGCRVKLIGNLQSLKEGMPILHYDVEVPRYCFFVEEVLDIKTSHRNSLLTTVAIMFTSDAHRYQRWSSREDDNS